MKKDGTDGVFLNLPMADNADAINRRFEPFQKDGNKAVSICFELEFTRLLRNLPSFDR